MQEIWKDIPGYDGAYQVSNLGRVRSIRIMNPFTLNSGYLGLSLYKDKKEKHFLIHRLVASAFCENPNNFSQVNHKDENKMNNCADNLEWCTNLYNRHYGTGIERMRKKKGKAIKQFTLNGELVAEYPSIMDAERTLGFDHSSICACCKGKKKQYNGFVWKYV